jgi:hypothetical protein
MVENVTDSLNQSGILWFNRALPFRAFLYFQASSEYYEWLRQTLELSADESAEIDLLCTHSHFYLAQVYASFEMLVESSRYCLSTLEMQLHAAGGFDQKEWVKNCLRLVDYYMDASSVKEVFWQ